jgi:DUF438 domain-containing protein
MGSLAAAFREHMENWTSMSIEDDWATYKIEATTLLTALERRVQREEDTLYPLALQDSSTTV